MKWTICFFVRDLSTRRIVHHEIYEEDVGAAPAYERARRESERIRELMKEYPSADYDVFSQGFDSLKSLYSAFPELEPKT